MKPLNEIVDYVVEIKEDRAIRILFVPDLQVMDGAQCRYETRLPESAKAYFDVKNLDKLGYKYLRQAIEKTNPDLLVFGGDNVYGEFDDKGTLLQDFIRRVDGYKIPWCAVFGNHDNDCDTGVEFTLQQYENAKYSLFKRHEELEGNSNTSVAVVVNGKLKNVLFMMDTNGCMEGPQREGVIRRPSVFDKQKEWFSRTCDELRAYDGKTVPAIFFSHIAFRAMSDGLHKKYGYTSKIQKYSVPPTEEHDGESFRSFDIPEDNPYGDFGVVHDDMVPMIDDYEFIDRVKAGGVMGMFFGHVHGSNASIEHEGMRYTYGLKTGMYVHEDKDLTGATLIQLDGKNMKIEHCYHDYSLDLPHEQ